MSTDNPPSNSRDAEAAPYAPAASAAARYELVVLGGGVVEALGEQYLEPIRWTAYQNFINKRGAKDVKIVPAQLGDQAGLLGAATWARYKLAKD